jgi:hypothetical protein
MLHTYSKYRQFLITRVLTAVPFLIFRPQYHPLIPYTVVSNHLNNVFHLMGACGGAVG